MNIFEVSLSLGLIIIAVEKKIIFIPFNKKSIFFGKKQVVAEYEEIINQIQLMRENILVVLSNSGLVHTFEIIKGEPKNKKTFNAKTNYHDNSVWSVDCNYPYIVVGGNHKCVLMFNYEESKDESNLKSFLYTGNNHNIPSVAISGSTNFIASNSIDTEVKIFDRNKGNLISRFPNVNSEWGWGVKFIPKELFKFKNFDYKSLLNQGNENSFIMNLLGLAKSHLTNKVMFPEDNHKFDYEKMTPYDKYLKSNLIDKYYILSSFQNIATFIGFEFIPEEEKRPFYSGEVVKTDPLSSIDHCFFEGNLVIREEEKEDEEEEEKEKENKGEEEEEEDIKELENKEKDLNTQKEKTSIEELKLKIVPVYLGKIELLRNLIKAKFSDLEQLDFRHAAMLRDFVSSSRYEYIFSCKRMGLLFLGNKNGDLQVFKMEIEIDDKEKMGGIKDEPVMIIYFGERLAGIRIFEMSDKVAEIYALSLTGVIYNYKIKKNERDSSSPQEIGSIND